MTRSRNLPGDANDTKPLPVRLHGPTKKPAPPLLRPLAIAALLAVFGAAPAHAHTGTGLAGGFVAGLLHPLSGMDHLLAMVSVGLWGAVLGRPLLVALPVIFPAMMAGGAMLGMFAVPVPPVEFGIALSVLMLGTAIATGLRPPVWLACAMVGLFALFHGYAHGRELPSAADPIGYSAGFVLSTGLLHVVGIAIGALYETGRGRLLIKGLGAAIGAAGLYFLTSAVL